MAQGLFLSTGRKRTIEQPESRKALGVLRLLVLEGTVFDEVISSQPDEGQSHVSFCAAE